MREDISQVTCHRCQCHIMVKIIWAIDLEGRNKKGEFKSGDWNRGRAWELNLESGFSIVEKRWLYCIWSNLNHLIEIKR
jgi:hypothetical protein